MLSAGKRYQQISQRRKTDGLVLTGMPHKKGLEQWVSSPDLVYTLGDMKSMNVLSMEGRSRRGCIH